jgi:hypothetical protein
MRLLNLISNCALAAALFQAASVDAASLNFAGGKQLSDFDGDVPVTSIGGIALPKGTVSLAGNTIEINAVPDWLFDRHAVMSGVIFDEQLDSSGASPKVTGSAYLLRGEWLKNLGRNVAPEIVSIKGGDSCSGHIVGSPSETELEMILSDGTRKTLKLDEIASITSPRAFTFEIPTRSVKISPTDNTYVADAVNVNFRPSMFHSQIAFYSRKPKVPVSTLPGTEGGISNKTITFLAVNSFAVNTLANAIAIPIIFARSSSLGQEQILFRAGNLADGLNPYTPQRYANGTIHFYPSLK